MAKYAVGIDVGGTHIKIGLFDRQMQLVASRQPPTDREFSAEDLMDFLTRQTQSLVS